MLLATLLMPVSVLPLCKRPLLCAEVPYCSACCLYVPFNIVTTPVARSAARRRCCLSSSTIVSPRTGIQEVTEVGIRVSLPMSERSPGRRRKRSRAAEGEIQKRKNSLKHGVTGRDSSRNGRFRINSPNNWRFGKNIPEGSPELEEQLRKEVQNGEK